MINFNDIGSWHFVTELDAIEVTATSDVVVSINDAGGTSVISGTYTPVDGVVHIYHLHKLLSPLITRVTAAFSITVGSTTKKVNVVQSHVAIDMTASKFLPSFFLSSVTSERDTALGRKELITILPTETDLVAPTVTAYYFDGSKVVSATPSLSAALKTGTPSEIDVSPNNFVDDAKGTLVAYTVTCGKRSMQFRVSTLPTVKYALLARNNFGAWEPVYFQGMSEESHDYTRETAYINGQLSLYHIDETCVIKSYTGPLRPAGIALARDLARSREVVMLDNGKAADPVVVTEVDVKHSTADDELADFSISWRRASIICPETAHYNTPKLFDTTFDDTYN